MENVSSFHIRPATSADVPLILSFIRQLAEYEKLSDAVTASEDLLRETLFGSRAVAEVLLGYDRDQAVAFAVFFHNFSTFLGRPGLYLEDLFVIPEMRGRGFGQAMLGRVAQIALERNCGRVEWSVLDWNQSAMGFYKKLGAMPLDDWITCRMTGAALVRLAAISSNEQHS